MTPDGLKAIRLGSIAEKITSGSRDWAQYYSDSGSKFIRMTNLPRDGIHLKLDDLKYVDVKSCSADGQRTSLSEGDILISITAELGKIGIVPRGLGEAYINQHTALVRLMSNEASPTYVAYLLSSHHLNYTINRLNDAGAKAGLNLSTIKAIPINLPPLPEQKKIAQILSTWDKATETVEKMIENSQQKKKALMQQLLTGKKRFPGFDGEWKEVRLGEVIRISTAASKSKYLDEDGERYIIDMGSVSREGRLIPSKRTSYTKDYLCKGQLVMPKDDIGGGNIIGRVGYIDQDDSYVLGDHVYALTVLKVDALFLNYLINSFQINKSFRRKANGTAQLGLGKRDVEKQLIRVPQSLEEQKRIASALLENDAETDLLYSQLDVMKREKKALMQQLLTGKKRVRVN